MEAMEVSLPEIKKWQLEFSRLMQGVNRQWDLLTEELKGAEPGELMQLHKKSMDLFEAAVMHYRKMEEHIIRAMAIYEGMEREAASRVEVL